MKSLSVKNSIPNFTIHKISVKKNSFIFVVCGAREHIDTLHYSLEYLKKYSGNEIWVLTDSNRNEIPVVHDKIVDIRTPEEFNHHQASIYLKTGIHKFFPKGNRYCYLDTDIIALSGEVDAIFNEYQAPVTFAPDHCRMNQFSPYAVNCGCTDLYEKYNKRIEACLIEIDPLRNSTKPSVIENRKKMVAFYQANNSITEKIKTGLRFLFSPKRFFLVDDIYFDKKEKTWKDKTGEVFMHHFRWPQISRKNGLRWNYLNSHPLLPDGRSLWELKCNHLAEAIENKFKTPKPSGNFQHWNGGVFLFDDNSHTFLDKWFDSTMEIFKDPYWKTRDQGTLIKTVWEMGLQNHPTLHKKWNAIADYHDPYLKWIDNKTVQLNKEDIIQPALLHVYHHFGDETWNFWNEIPKIE